MMGDSATLPAKDQLPLGQFRNRSATNQMGRVLPTLYGTNRVGGTFISEFFDIVSDEVTGGKSGTVEGANYYASFAVAICHGPVLQLNQIFLNSTPVYTTSTRLYTTGLSVTDNIATFNTANPHGLVSGDVVFVFFAFQVYFNGQFTITVTSPTQFQYTIPGETVPNGNATQVYGYGGIYCLISLPPLIATGDSNDITIPDFGTATIYWGTLTQPADSYLSNVSGITHPPYKGICYIVFRQLFLGFNQTNAQNVEVVVTRAPSFAWQSNPGHAIVNPTYNSANPGNIVADLLLNPRSGLGLAGGVDVNTAMLDAAIEQFYGYGIGLSPITTREDDLRSQILSVLENVDGTPALDANGLLGIIFAVAAATVEQNNALVFQCPNICDDNLTDVPTFTPADWSSVINQTFLTFIDSDAGWVMDYVSWQSNAGILGKARPEPQTLDRPAVTDVDTATVLCGIFGQIAALPKCTGKLQLAWNDELYAELTAGSVFYFSSKIRSVYNAVYRITSVTLSDPAKPVIELEFQIDRSYLYENAQAQLVLLADA
jgi:hypothetical protein